MNQKFSRICRSGVTTIESAVVLSTLFMVLFVIFDLGLATFRSNVLSAASRRAARAAIVHGSGAPPEQTAWGPAAFTGTAADSSEIASAVASLLPTMNSSDVAVQVTWPDGNNRENDRVQVRLTYIHHPFLPFLSLGDSINLNAESDMRIVH